mmetsp:Transcript_26210/g.61218  ORF Transcript_26210/g.61218 Transcript_26210/m.61218 type:complete len:255 (+) Transcript_26210:990-1754(+)
MMAQRQRGLPAVKDLGMLARGAVARARHIAHDAVIALPITALFSNAVTAAGGRRRAGHLLRRMVGDDKRGGAQAEGGGALDERVAPKRGEVVCHHHALPTVETFDQLRRLAPGRRAHVQYMVAWMQLQRRRWQHARQLLPHETARVCAADEPLAHSCLVGSRCCVAQLVLVHVELPARHQPELASAKPRRLPLCEYLLPLGAEVGGGVSREAEGNGERPVQRVGESGPARRWLGRLWLRERLPLRGRLPLCERG